VRLGVNFQARHNEAAIAARDAVQDGRVGEVVLVDCEVAVARAPRSGWRTERALAGLGTVHNLGVHAFDLIRYVTGAEVTEVVAMLDADVDVGPETLAVVLMRLSGGAIARVTASEVASRPSATLTVQGTAGRIVGQGLTPPARGPARLAVLAGDGPEQALESSTDELFARAVAAFQRAVAEGSEPNAGADDGLRSAELVAAIAQSARAGAVVALPRR
jgi:predicted dehydrogenase